MDTTISELKDIIEILKSMLKKAGLKVRSKGGSESCAALLLPDSGTRLEIEWKPLVNRAETSSENIRVTATRILSQKAFSRCVESGQSVLDAAGNGFISVPGFRFERFVAVGQPRRLPVSGTPFSARASRIVRGFLSEPQREWSQSELVDATSVTQGYASKCLKMLMHHSYLVLSGTRWRLQTPDSLLDDWAAHYRFDRHSQYRFAMSSPSYDDGLKLLGGKLSKAGIRYAYTGWSGAHLRMPYAVPQKIMAFVDSVPDDPKSLGLFPVESKENILLIIPRDEGVFHFSQDIDGLIAVSDPQIYVDLYRLPGRAREQAQVLRSRLMNGNESDHG